MSRTSKPSSPDAVEPPAPVGAMWAPGFEASPYSPAGQLQGEAAFFRGLASGSARSRKAFAVALGGVLAFVALVLLAWGISALLH